MRWRRRQPARFPRVFLIAAVATGACRSGGDTVTGPQGPGASPAPPAVPAPPTPSASTASPAPDALAGHPRLFLSAPILRRLKAKAQAGDADWKTMSEKAERLAKMPVARYDRNTATGPSIGYSYQGFGWLDAVTALGLAYRATNQARYAAKVREILGAINATAAAGNLEPIQVDRGFPSRSAALAAALAFDWVYPTLSPAERAATVSTINRWFDWYRAEALDRDGPAVSNYFGGHLLGFGAAGYATAGDNPRATEIVSHVRQKFDGVVPPAFAKGPFAGGYPIEGYVYGTNQYARLLQYLAVVGSATGKLPPEATDYAEKIAGNLFHALKPNGWQVPDEGAYPGDSTGVLSPGLPVMLTDLLAGASRGPAAQYLVRNAGHPPKGIAFERPTFEYLLYWDSARPAADYGATEPLFFHSAGDEHLFMRSSWAPGAVWASFTGGVASFSGHQARTAGHLAIQRGGDLLMPYSGQWKGKSGLEGQPQQFQSASAYASTLFVDDGGAYLYKAEPYLGGQGAFAAPRPLLFAQRGDVSWAKLDATPAYDRQTDQQDPAARSVRRFVRNFAYLAPATFVIFDRVTMLKPEFKKEIRFQLAAAPTVAGDLATSIVGSSALYVRALLPHPASLEVAWNTVNGARLNPWLAISTAGASSQLDALTVVSAGDRRQRAPEATSVSAEGGLMVGAQVAASGDAARETVALFASTPDGAIPAGAAIRYRVRSTAPGRHYLFDLAPTRSYRLRADAVPGSPGTVAVTVAPDGPGVLAASTDAGMLAFDLVGGQIRVAP